MFKVKLTALEHPLASNLNIEDPKDFRNLVLWLEDQKIRFYKIEDRAGLRKVNDPTEWERAYEKYKNDLGCPISLTTHQEVLAWILAHAIKLEYSDNPDKFRPVSAARFNEKKSTAPSIKSTNPFDNLDFNSKEFEMAVRNLALKFEIPHHPDHLVVLAAISRLVKQHLSTEALKEQIPEGKPYPIFDGAGMSFENPEAEKAARILRLLQIHSVRDLQTAINEAIVSVQNLTADPRTDTKLGKVGF